jgi:hypothetical protein
MKKAFLFLLFCCLSLLIQAQSLDFRILRSLNEQNRPAWDRGMTGISNSVYPAMPLSVAGIWAHGYFSKDRGLMRNAGKSALTMGLSALVTAGLKVTVNRSRPAVQYPGEIIPRSLTYRKWYVAVPSYLYAGLVGYSRMRLGVHFPTDILAGMLIGAGSGFLIWEIDKLIQRRK